MMPISIIYIYKNPFEFRLRRRHRREMHIINKYTLVLGDGIVGVQKIVNK